MKTYTTIADIMLVTSGSEHCFVHKREATGNTAAIDVHRTRTRGGIYRRPCNVRGRHQ